MRPIVPNLGLLGDLAMESSSIGDVLFTKTQQKVLSLLYGQTDGSFYMNEIVRIADIGK